MLSWSAALLAHHPEAQRKVLAEIDAAFPPSSSSSPRPPLSPGDAGKLPTLEAVLLESMRLLPPAYIVGRHAANGARLSRRRKGKGEQRRGGGRGGREEGQDAAAAAADDGDNDDADDDDDDDGKGNTSSSSSDFWELPPGTSVLVSPYLLHRDANSWDSPRRFLPERWLPMLRGEEGAEKTSSGPGGIRSMPLLAGMGPNGCYLPFGAGPRVCVGASFAMLEGVLVLAALLRVAELRPLEGAEGEGEGGGARARFPAAEPRLTLRPSGAGVRLRLVPRDRDDVL